MIPSEAQFDNPFLVNYAVYHYYRSLGWIVKSGIKFCVDLLLYKGGPVLHHAECVICSLTSDFYLLLTQVRGAGHTSL